MGSLFIEGEIGWQKLKLIDMKEYYCTFMNVAGMKVGVQENDQIPGHIRVSGKAATCGFWHRAGKNSRMNLCKDKEGL